VRVAVLFFLPLIISTELHQLSHSLVHAFLARLGDATITLAAFSIVVQSNATRSALLLWLPPMQNTDGSPLTDLAGYKVYWGTSQGPYPNSITLSQSGLASYRVENLSPNTYYFVITAFNSSGVESGFSNVTSITLP